MGSQAVQFARHYRAALLDHLLNRDESGLVRATALGRRAVATGLGLLHVVHSHHDSLNTVLQSTRASDERLRHLQAAQEFLLEALSIFEMTHRGFLERMGQHAGRNGKALAAPLADEAVEVLGPDADDC